VTDARTQPRNYVTAFAAAVRDLTRAGEDAPALLPEILVRDFEATRAELWLWDVQSSCFYLTHVAGQRATHGSEYAEAGKGALGRLSREHNPVENAPLSAFWADDPEFAGSLGLSVVSAYPLVSAEQLAGALLVYGPPHSSGELMMWWKLFAETSAVKIYDVLASQEKERRIRQLNLLFEATRLLNSTLDLTELLELILRIARTEVKADRGTVFLADHKHNELWSIVASGLEHQEIRIPFGKGIAGRVVATGETINTEDAYSLEYFEPTFDQKFNYRTRSLLSVPVRHQSGQIVGVIQLLNAQSGRFSDDDVEFLSKLSGHMAMALENARLHRDSLEKQRVERELALARGIQRRLLPDAPPIVPGFDIAVLRDFCFDVAGDYHDFLHLGPHSLLLVSAEVAAKGVPAALLMSTLQATLRALVIHLHSLEVLAFSLNEILHAETRTGKYLSVFMGLIDTRRKILHYINAGHVPPLLVRGRTSEVKLLEEGGAMLGFSPQADYTRGSVKLGADDILVCSTDGILQIPNEQGQPYGAPRLAELVRRNRDRNAQAIVDAVLVDVSSYPGSSMNVDDKMLIVLKVNSDSSASSTDEIILE